VRSPGDEVVVRSRRIAAEAGDRGVDNVGLDGADRFVVEAEGGYGRRRIVRDEDVRAFEQPLRDLETRRRLQVEADAALAGHELARRPAAVAPRLRSVAVPLEPRRSEQADHVGVPSRLDLDHLCAEVGEIPATDRSGDRDRELADAQALERALRSLRVL